MKIEDYIASGILEEYVLGELSPAEASQVDKMAAQYPEVRGEIRLIQETLEAMAFDLAKKPSPGVLDMIKDKIDRKEKANLKSELPKKKKKITFLRYGIAATFTLKLAAMAFAASFWIHWKNTEKELSQLQKQYNALEQKANQVTQALLAVSDPEVQTIELTNQKVNPDLRILLYWNPVTHKIYINTEKLPRNDEHHQYQLWGFVRDNPLSLGVFDRNNQVPTLILLEGKENLSGFALTLEPAGGSTSPTLTRLIGEGKIK